MSGRPIRCRCHCRWRADRNGWSLDKETIRRAFETAYKAAFGRLLDGIPQRVMNLRVAVIGRRPKFDLALLAPGADASVERASLGARPVWQDGAWADTALYDRMALPVGTRIDGPALLEQADTTIFVDGDLAATVDRYGNLVIERGGVARWICPIYGTRRCC